MSPGSDRQEHTPSPLTGRVVVVTGASDGVGKAAVRGFVQQGAQVVMVGRNEAKTAAAARAIMSDCGSRAVSWEIADLSDPDAVGELAERLLVSHPRVHLLVNNAGAMFLERELTRAGFERTFALNHLSYVQLGVRLLPALFAAAVPGDPSRLINVASRAHENAKPDLDDLQGARAYGGWRAYANSKLFNLWFTRALAARVDAARLSVQAVHPGVVSTRFATNNGRLGRVLRRVMDLNSVTPEQGADTVLWLATAPEALANPGGYWVRRRLTTPSRLARDSAMSEQLWARTGALLHLDLDAMVHAASAAVVP